MEYFSRRNIRAFSLAILLFVYPVIALSFFSVKYIETVHRITVLEIFDASLFGSIQADSLAIVGFGLLFLGLSSRLLVSKAVLVATFAAAASAFVLGREELVIGALVVLPAIAALLTAVAIADRRRPLADFSSRFPLDGKRVAGAFLLIVIVIEAGALARWIAYPLYPSEIYSDPTWKFAEIESALFHSLGLLSPVLLALLAFSFLYRWFIARGFERISRSIAPARENEATDARASLRHTNEADPADIPKVNGTSRKSASLVMEFAKSTNLTSKYLHRGLLVLAISVAPLLMIYPHLPMINPGGEGVSTDELYYTKWMNEFRALLDSGDDSWQSIIGNAFRINGGDRPLTLLLLFFLANSTGASDLFVIRFLPVSLAPALVVSNYFLLRYTLDAKKFGINRIKVFASIGAAFTVFSPQIVVGEYAGFLANWLALITFYFAFFFLIRAWQESCRKSIIISYASLSAILTVTMLLHVYTWAHLLTAIVIFAVVTFILARKHVTHSRLKLLIMGLIVASSFSVDYVKSTYSGAPAVGQSDSVIITKIPAHDPLDRWERLGFTLSAYVGGFLSVPALFLLALVWIIRAKNNGLELLLLSMVFICALPLLNGSYEFQTRVFYNTPFHLIATMALIWTIEKTRHRESKILQKLLILCVILSLAVYATSAMANLAVPEGFQLEQQFILN